MDLGLCFPNNMESYLKWVHMARYELILRLDGALWLTIISKTPVTPKTATEGPNPKLAPRRGPIRVQIISSSI